VDLRQLRYFTQIVESGSLSKASRQLFIAQPALSQQLSKLESEVGKPLFSRSSKGVVPTENGLALYHHARFMLRQLEQALSIARKDSGAVQGMVSVGLPATPVSALYGEGKVHHVRRRRKADELLEHPLVLLEDEMVTWDPASGRSPSRTSGGARRGTGRPSSAWWRTDSCGSIR